MIGIRKKLLAAAIGAACAASPAIAGEPGDRTAHLSVTYDQSTVLRLDQPAKTIIVGNPAIADVQLVNDRTLYVIGRMFGNTNLIAVGADGTEVLNTHVTVEGADIAQVTLFRGPAGQRTLACAPRCERTITQGDADMSTIVQDSDRKVEISQKAAALSGR